MTGISLVCLHVME